MSILDDRILAELLSTALDDDELATLLGVRRQAVNQACRRLAESGLLTRTSAVGSKIVNRLPPGAQHAPKLVPSPSEPDKPTPESTGLILSGLGFEAHARAVLAAAWGVELRSRVVTLRGGVTHSFDLVSLDESVVGDAKWFKDLKPIPAAKLSIISEYVWLLQSHERASRRFLVFGQDRAVPERWLRRFEPLLGGVEVWFLKGVLPDRLA